MRAAERLPFSQRLLLVFATPMLIWVLASVIGVIVLQKSLQQYERVARNQDTLLLAAEYSNIIQDVIEEERGAGRGVIQRANQMYSRLDWLSRDEPAQAATLLRASEIFPESFYDMNRTRTDADGDDGAALRRDFQETMGIFISMEQEMLDGNRAAIVSRVQLAQWVALAGLLLGIVAMWVVARWMARRIGSSVDDISHAADELAKGNLSARIPHVGKEDELANRFNLMAELIEKRTRETAVLAALGEMLQSCDTIAEALQVFAQFAEALFPVQPGVLYMIEPNRIDVSAVTSWWNGEKYSEENLAFNDCWALRLSKPHENVAQGKGGHCEHIKSLDVESRCIPLPAFGEVIGLLFIVTRDESNERMEPEHTKRFSDIVAEQVALALANVKLREMLRNQAIRDPLTQLYNRRHLDEVFQRELHRAKRHEQPLSVLMFDIDNFKTFNDTHGHDGGDAALRYLGETLREFFRPEDETFRIGGEEFMTLLPGTELEDAMKRAETLRQEVEGLRIMKGNTTLPGVTISIGVASYPGNGQNEEQLCKAADQALYRAKDAGRNCVVSAGKK
ncbi:MAG: diguanylate cyclase [Proteobacteria bacterium]|nr:diguanylate cyclase [Pseudomonadota bacterium]